MRPKRYTHQDLEPDDLPPVPPEGPRYRVYAQSPFRQGEAVFLVPAPSPEEAMEQVAKGLYGLGWVPVRAEPD